MREDFEYDEADEADEGFVEADEADEADEGFAEADEADEGFAEADEADEGFAEASDEGDGEADEAIDEAVTVSAAARLRAEAARNRQERWARKIELGQRREALRAAATQRSITDRLRSVRPGGRTRVYSVGSLQGAGVVTAILPNGRQSRMRIIPTMAPISEVNRLRSAIMVNDKRQVAATANNSRAITSLATAQAAAVKKLTDQQVKSDKDLAKRLVEGDNRLDKRITKELSGGTGVLDKQGKRMMRVLRRQRQRSLMNGVLLATAMPFFAAYGDRESPLTKNNAILTGSLLGWLVGDELLDMFGGKSGVARGGATLWSYAAPLLNAGTVYFFLGDKQHVRFLSGITDVPTTGTSGPVDLTREIADGAVEDFEKATNIKVVASFIGPGPVLGSGYPVTAPTLSATVASGKLTLDVFPAPAAPTKVAWIVDTKPASKSA